jgi:hypothetical protein
VSNGATTDDDEKKKGGHSGLRTVTAAERIQQACPLFFVALQTRFEGIGCTDIRSLFAKQRTKQ